MLFSSQSGQLARRSFYYARFRGLEITKPTRVELRLPEGSAVASGRLVGRGDQMHFFDDSGWYRIQVDEVSAER